MPKTKTGWTLDESALFTAKQWDSIKKLIQNGKIEEAQRIIEKVLKEQAQA